MPVNFDAGHYAQHAHGVRFERMPCLAMGLGPDVHLGSSTHNTRVEISGADISSRHITSGSSVFFR